MATSRARRIEQLKEVTGLSDFSNVSVDEFAIVQREAGEGHLDQKQMKLLVQEIPNFIELQRAVIDGIKANAAGAQANQNAALQAVDRSLDAMGETLNELARRAESDSLRRKLAEMAVEVGRLALERARIIERINKDNNETSTTTTQTIKDVAVVGGVGLAALGLLAIFLTKSRD